MKKETGSAHESLAFELELERVIFGTVDARSGCGINVKNSEPTTCLSDIFTDRQKELLNTSSTQRPTSVMMVPPTREVILGGTSSLSPFRCPLIPAPKNQYVWPHSKLLFRGCVCALSKTKPKQKHTTIRIFRSHCFGSMHP